MPTHLSQLREIPQGVTWVSNPPNNRKFNYEKYTYVNLRKGIKVTCTEYELRKNFGICRQSVQDLKSDRPGSAVSAKGFYLLSVAQKLGLVT